MYAVGRLGSYLSRSAYTVSGPFHPFGGAVDIVVVEQPDGSFKSSPWYVKFGKFQGVLKTKEKVVAISVNNVAANFHMYLNHKGEAYFLREVEMEEGEAPLDPLSSLEEPDEPLVRDRRPMKSMSCNYEMEKRKTMEQFDAGNGKIVARTTSRRSRIFGFVFGRRSMKEDSFQDEGDGPGVVRVNSLERAELAADLLEMNWSTNLVSSNYRKDRSSLLSAPGCEKNAGDRDVLAADEQEKFVPSMSHNREINIHDPSLQNETASCRNEQNYNSSGSEVQEQEFAEDAVVRMSSISSTEQVAEAFQSAETILEEKLCDYPNASGNGYHDEAANGGILSTCGVVRRIYFKEGGAVCSSFVTPNEDSESNSVPSFAYTEASDNLVMRLGGSTEQTYEALDVFGGENRKGSPHVETLLLGADPLSEGAIIKQAEEMELDVEEEITRPEEPYAMTRDAHQVGHFGDQAKTDRSIAEQIGDCGTNTGSPPSESSEEEQFLFSDLDECKLHRSDHVNTSNGRTEEGQHQFTSINGCSYPPIIQFAQDNQSMDVMTPNEHSKTMQSHTRTLSSNIKSCEKAPRKVDSLPDMLSPDAELDAYDRHLFSHSLDSSSELIKMEFLCKDDYVVEDDRLADIKNCNRSSDLTSSPVHTLSSQIEREADSCPGIQSPHDKLDAYGHPQSRSTNSNLRTLKMEIYGNIDSVIQGDESADSTGNSSGKLRISSNPSDILSSCNVGTEKPEQQLELLPDIWSPNSSSESVKTELYPETNSNIEDHPPAYSNSYNGTSASPIRIPTSHKVAKEASGRQIESMPNMLSSDVKLDAHDHHCLSHSLGSKNESMNMALSSKDESNTEEFWTSWNLKDVHKHPAVELSLCKHLLFEGMGADAAAQAFDAEKLDSSKFEAMGSTILENDRLAVRICGRYFPWSAAAPIVLGMLAFGNQEIFEPKGMIPVDQHEQAKDVVSWRIWPFSFKRSQSGNNMPPNLTNARNDVGNVVDSTIVNEDVEKKLVEQKKVKKMIRATTPTSEQLASLNLKEGSNTVTFTFSTAMLGNQKVDARIYLWKWNARIVISDVDGTITKSDVLGQFMPLMGVDWSQTGVTHLFSGIRENGYHFLFLSARAISQAYITRQFLINLKQDGKALPDGPIVISPDGLFPSLYREVIRRAPHEFKIACLEDIKALFPPDCNPFYAGFGNRDTDEISYLKVGIPKGKIFIINPKGEVVVNRHTYTQSYTSLHTLVHDMFPQMNTSEQEDFNSWNYWKLPPPLVEN